MTDTPRLMVFTDLDGTLIDHDTYSWKAAEPALMALRSLGAGVVLASSKTSAEITGLRDDLGLVAWPAIVENGAGLLPPHSTQVALAGQYHTLRDALDRLPAELRQGFEGFGDMSIARVSELTGLSADAAELAKRRLFSEPGLWRGPDALRPEFLSALLKEGIVAQQGGRFLTLSFGGNKVDQMRSIIEQYRPEHTVALGDAPNDLAMIQHADFGVIVANPSRPPLEVPEKWASARILRTTAVGPLGWNEAILQLLGTLDLI